ncbi:MAG: thiolase family protein [Chromatiales bacterium]|jgi:acetyl-CoA acetyltransferase|nr:thiolase family protein [Chromatiales bacterium]
MNKAYIPYGAYWSTPFARWQGALAHLHSLQFGAHVAARALAKRLIDVSAFDYGVLGMSIPQQGSFYGLPWLTGLVGADSVGGPTIAQACATGARVLSAAVQEIQSGAATCVLTVTTDRTSNGPHIYYPDPMAMGGTGRHENWVLDNFSRDPYGNTDMTRTAENCATKWKVDTALQHDVVLRRYEQYRGALTNDAAFHRRYMDLPFEVPDARFKRTITTLESDEGIHPVNAEGLTKLKPVLPDGSVTFGGQTHPADGACGMVVASADKVADLSKDPCISITVEGFGMARAEKSFMPAATIPAAQRALTAANVLIKDVDVFTSHNPFAVNDIIFATDMGIDVMNMNNFGCSLIWGHPQGPTGTRSIIELIEELVLKGGGTGLFQGCAAGDCAMAVVIRVEDRR